MAVAVRITCAAVASAPGRKTFRQGLLRRRNRQARGVFTGFLHSHQERLVAGRPPIPIYTSPGRRPPTCRPTESMQIGPGDRLEKPFKKCRKSGRNLLFSGFPEEPLDGPQGLRYFSLIATPVTHQPPPVPLRWLVAAAVG